MAKLNEQIEVKNVNIGITKEKEMGSCFVLNYKRTGTLSTVKAFKKHFWYYVQETKVKNKKMDCVCERGRIVNKTKNKI